MRNNKILTRFCIKYSGIDRKAGFTLVELIISIIISSVVLLITFTSVADSMVELSNSNRQSKILSSFYDFTTKTDNYVNILTSSKLLVDNVFGSGSDVVLLHNESSSFGVILGIVDKSNMKLESISAYDLYYDKVLGFRELSASELSDLKTTPLNAYNYTFHNDKIFSGFSLKDFQVETYNTGSIIDINLSIVSNYKDGLSGESWTSLSGENLFKVNINF